MSRLSELCQHEDFTSKTGKTRSICPVKGETEDPLPGLLFYIDDIFLSKDNLARQLSLKFEIHAMNLMFLEHLKILSKRDACMEISFPIYFL